MLSPISTQQCRVARDAGGSRIALAAGLLLAAAQPAQAVEIAPDRRTLRSGAHVATGHVICGAGSGTAQLVKDAGTIITAAHVLYGRNGLRGAAADCRFDIVIDGASVSTPIDVSRVRAGTANPYGAHASFDWAVARLKAPVAGVSPYALGNGLAMGEAVTLVSGRTLPASRAVMAERCLVRALREAEGGREAVIDCSAQAGDSGAALLDRAGRIAAIYVGFRSATPRQRQEFSDTHYNFAVAISPKVRAALQDLAR